MDYDYIDMIVEEFEQILFAEHWHNELVDYWYETEDGHGNFVMDVPSEIFECVLTQAVKNVNGLIKFIGGTGNEIKSEEKDRKLGEENSKASDSDGQKGSCESSSDGYRRFIEQLCKIEPIHPSWLYYDRKPTPVLQYNPYAQNCCGCGS